MQQRKKLIRTVLLLVIAVVAWICVFVLKSDRPENPAVISLESIPQFSGEPYVVLNGNVPGFTEKEITDKSYEFYSELDALNRCGYTMASIGKDLMPTEERGNIGQVKPSGWHTVKYDFVDGKYLYNRCHLIGFQLTGENANERNLITGTRYLNVEGMLPFENMVADYVKETGNHVMYRVTPIFEGEEMLARGVQIEALSVEDGGEGICFHVFAYNCQPGVTIDYQTGESAATAKPEETAAPKYVANTASQKFHGISCAQAKKIKEENRKYSSNREDLIADGFSPSGCCNP